MRAVVREDLASELREMARQDQDMRRAWVAGGRYDDDVDRRNTEQLRRIVAEIGWPIASIVGTEAAHLAWLLVQHADADPAFQQHALELMRTAPVGEVTLADMACLEDRVNVRFGRPQRFGTQFRVLAGGEVEPYPIAEPDGLDARRAAMELGSFAQYRETVIEAQRRPIAGS